MLEGWWGQEKAGGQAVYNRCLISKSIQRSNSCLKNKTSQQPDKIIRRCKLNAGSASRASTKQYIRSTPCSVLKNYMHDAQDPRNKKRQNSALIGSGFDGLKSGLAHLIGNTAISL